MSFQLKNKVVWITGASSGIGQALAKDFYKSGSKLVLSGRNKAALDSLALTLGSNENCLVLPFDLKNISEFQNFFDQILEKFGSCDVLVNNAGFSQRSFALETTQEIEQSIMMVDYFAQVALAKTVLPKMIENKFGKIIVISSIAGIFGFYYRSSYSAAKHALKGYFESLRLEVEENNISILLVYPGKIKTSISLNAISTNGIKHNVMDPSHTNAMDASACSMQILKAMQSNKEYVFVGGKEILMVWIQKFFPFLFRWLIRKVKRD